MVRLLKSVMHSQCDARPTVTLTATEHHRPLTNTKLYCLVTPAFLSFFLSFFLPSFSPSSLPPFLPFFLSLPCLPFLSLSFPSVPFLTFHSLSFSFLSFSSSFLPFVPSFLTPSLRPSLSHHVSVSALVWGHLDHGNEAYTSHNAADDVYNAGRQYSTVNSNG